jgi:hypothetical protein
MSGRLPEVTLWTLCVSSPCFQLISTLEHYYDMAAHINLAVQALPAGTARKIRVTNSNIAEMDLTPARRRKAVPRSLQKFTRAVRIVTVRLSSRARERACRYRIAAAYSPISDNLRGREGELGSSPFAVY